MKMEKVSATFSVIMIPFMPGCEECMADQLDLDFCLLTNERYPDFKQKKTGEALWIEDR
jgi:hypothetical protein